MDRAALSRNGERVDPVPAHLAAMPRDAYDSAIDMLSLSGEFDGDTIVSVARSIADLGWQPAQRTTRYELVRCWDAPSAGPAAAPST